MLLRKVFCKDRLPDNILKHDTSEGDAQYIKGRWEYLGFVLESQPEWWFEEVIEPTDEGIEGKSSAKCKERMNAVWPLYQVGYEDGYKQALKDLKSK